MRPRAVLVTAFAACLVMAPSPARADHEAPAPELSIPRATLFNPWNASVRLFTGEDSNVAMAGDESGYSGTKGSPYVGLTAQGSFIKVKPGGWTAGVNGTLGRTVYTTGFAAGATDAPSEYDLTVFNPQLFANRPLNLLGRPARVELSYDFRSEDLGIQEISSRHHRFVARGEARPMPGLVTRATYRFTSFDSNVEFPEPQLNQRDGTFHQFDAEAVYHVPKIRGRVSVTYQRSNSNADGSNFDYDGNSFKVRVDNKLARTLWADLSMLKDMRSYGGYVSNYIDYPGRKAVDILKGETKLLWKFAPQWVADLHVKATRVNAETPWFRARRTIGGAGLTYYFSGGR